MDVSAVMRVTLASQRPAVHAQSASHVLHHRWRGWVNHRGAEAIPGAALHHVEARRQRRSVRQGHGDPGWSITTTSGAVPATEHLGQR